MLERPPSSIQSATKLREFPHLCQVQDMDCRLVKVDGGVGERLWVQLWVFFGDENGKGILDCGVVAATVVQNCLIPQH